MRARLAVSVFVLSTLALSAAETDSQPAPPAGDDAIAAAKRDFDTVKAARDPLLQPKDGLPELILPQLHTEEPAAPVARALSPDEKELKARKKSAHWLVDAMEQSAAEAKARGRTGRGDSRRLAPKQDETAGAALKPAADFEKTGDAMANDASAEKQIEPTAVVNPLASFMEAWMSRDDFALLRPVVDAARTSESSSGPSPANVTSTGELPTLSALMPGAPAPSRSAAPLENPFLQALSLPADPPSAPLTAALTPPAISTPPPQPASDVFTPPPPVSEMKPSVPDFVKQQADEKYFKPLKRF